MSPASNRFNLLKFVNLSLKILFGLTILLASPTFTQADTIEWCAPSTFYPDYEYCRGSLPCANGPQTCGGYCKGNQTGAGDVQCNPDPNSSTCILHCSGGGGGSSSGPRPSDVWVRVLSRDGTNGKPIAWKGNNSLDRVWDTRWNEDWVPNAWSVQGLDASGNFQQYKAVETGPTKSWDLSRNKISNGMNFNTSNIVAPVQWFTEISEYWSNHFCIAARPYEFDSSNPQGLNLRTEYNRKTYCDLIKKGSSPASYYCKQDVDGCYTPPEPDREDETTVADNYGTLKRLLDYANGNPPRGSMAWADLRFDEYWSLYYKGLSKTDTELFLAAPTGYTCKDVRWFKNHEDRTSEEDPADEFSFTINADGSCTVNNFQLSVNGNFFVFEVEKNTIDVGGRVVNAQTGAGISNVSITVEKLNGVTNAYISSQTTTTNGSGYYSVPNFIGKNDKYNIRVNTTAVSGYLGNAYTIDDSQGFGSYIKRGYQTIGYSWNTIKNPNVGGENPWADTVVGESFYQGQKNGSADCAGSDDNGVTNRCWFAFDPPYTVSGRVVSSTIGAGMGGVTVTVQRLNYDGAVLQSTTTTTLDVASAASTGTFSVSNFVRYSDKYKIYVNSPPANSGFIAPGFAVKHTHPWGATIGAGSDIRYSWNHTRNPALGTSNQGNYPWGNTTTRELSYDAQKPGGADCSGNDDFNKSGRCWFTFDPAPPPPEINVTGNVSLRYDYPSFANYKKVKTDEYNYQYPVQFLKNGIWDSANWVAKTGSTDCRANFPDGTDVPNCQDYFSSRHTYQQNEFFSARMWLPTNKYKCFWQVLGSQPNGSGGYNTVDWGSGQISSANGGTYCTIPSSRIQSIVGKGLGMEGPMHINFWLEYESNRVTGAVFDAYGTILNPDATGLKIYQSYPNGSGVTGNPVTESGIYYSYPAYPVHDIFFSDFYKFNHKVGFYLNNPTNSYKCAWIFETVPNSNKIKTSSTEFRAAWGNSFNISNFNTYPAESTSLRRGMSDNCDFISPHTVQTGKLSPLYNNQLYIFRLEKTGRISGQVNVRYEYLNGSAINQDRAAARDDAGQQFVVETNTYNTTNGTYGAWQPVVWNNVAASGCSALYPDNTANTSGIFGMPNNCQAFITSNNLYVENSPNIRAVARLRYKPGKYNCTTTASGTPNVTKNYQALVSGIYYEYCETSPMSVLSDSTNTLSIGTRWPSEVSFNLTFKDNSITTTVFDRATVTSAYTPYGESGQIGLYQTSGSYRYFIVPRDSGDGWNPGSSTNALISLSGSLSDKVCFYTAQQMAASEYNGKSGSVNTLATALDWNEIYNGYNPVYNGTFDADCLNMTIPVRSGSFSPVYHNQAYITVAPKLRIGPSTITVVDSSSQCTDTGTLITNNAQVTLYMDFSPNINTSANFTGGNFDFLSTPLTYSPGRYRVGFQIDGMDLNQYGICPTTTNPSQSNPININLPTLLPTYPNIPVGSELIDASIKFYKKDANKWWQVYNGGVYVANGNLTLNSTATGEGMPTDAVLVGNANSATQIVPNYYANGVGYVGALVSPDAINPSSFNQYGLSGKNWGVLTNDKEMSRLNLDRVYDVASSEWKTVSTFSDAVNDSSDDAVFINSSSVTVGGALQYSRDKNKIVLISNSSGNSVLRLNANVSKGGFAPESGVLIVLVRGNVVIDPSVSNLRMVIYATGTITLPNSAPDGDNPLFQYGALYSDSDIVFNRDLPDNATYEKYPAERIIYPAEIFTRMDDIGSAGFPSVLTESKAFWVIEE